MNNLTYAFYEQARKNPQKMALRILPKNEIWTFEKASKEVDCWRVGLRSQFSKGDRILILFKPGADLFFILLACFAEGIIPFLIDPRLPQIHWRSALGKANLKGIFSEAILLWLKVFYSELRSIPSFVRKGWAPYSAHLKNLKINDAKFIPLVAHQSEDVSLITLTSGTTGEPKLIHRNFGALFEQQRMANKYLPELENDKHLAGYVVSILQSLCENAESLFDVTRNALTQIRNIEEYNVTRLSGPPGYIMKIVQLLKSQGRQLLQVQSVLVGGAPISRHFYLLTREVFPNAQVTIIYGATEVEPIAFETRPSVQSWDYGYPVGQFLPELKVHKRKVELTLVEEAFEIGVEGAHVVGNSIHWTGDLATELDSKIYFLGRVSELIEFEGRQYALGIMEAQLEGFNGLGRIAFVQKDGEIICFYEKENSLKATQIAEAEIRSYVRSRGFNLKITFCCLEKIPVDARHEWKIQRRELKNKYRS
jgi:acyl-coenzyme A synthetase/AMP-(fatty) acid ligase